MLYDSTVFASARIFPALQSSASHPKRLSRLAPGRRTRVDELLTGRIPSLLRSNLFFHLCDLMREDKSAVAEGYKTSSVISYGF